MRRLNEGVIYKTPMEFLRKYFDRNDDNDTYTFTESKFNQLKNKMISLSEGVFKDCINYLKGSDLQSGLRKANQKSSESYAMLKMMSEILEYIKFKDNESIDPNLSNDFKNLVRSLNNWDSDLEILL